MIARTKKLVLAIVALCVTLVAFSAPLSAAEVIPLFKLNGPLPEQPSTNGLAALLGDKAPLTMFDLLEKLKKARTDASVKAVIFDVDSAALGPAQIEELRGQLEALRAADKDVWVFSEGLSKGSLLLSSAASNVVLVPSGSVDVSGFYAESLYYKNMMDKIGIEADIIHCGDFKSAGEPFYLTGPSKPAEEQTNKLLDSMFDLWVKQIAKSRQITPEQMKEIVNKGLLQADEALEAKLVDKLMYREDFVKAIEKRYGDVTVTSAYGANKGPDLDLENPFAVFKLFGEMMKPPTTSTKSAIAVVYVENMITSGKSEEGMFGGASNAGSDTVRRAIAEAADDPSVKALVLRVDSPGGSALASDIMCEAAKRFKDSDRPFIVSMGNVAASGGYYVSALADRIFADRMTITGSIGVVGGKMVTKGFWDWAGVTGHEYKRGEHADIMNTNRKFDDSERALITKYMYDTYGDFKQRVLDGRKDKLKGEIESLAGGRVYTGEQAMDIGLIDQYGGFTDAVKYAAEAAEISDYELRVFPPQKTLADMLGEIFGGKESDDKFVIENGRAGATFASQPALGAMLESVRAIDPQKAKAISQFLIQMELFSKERVLMVGPTTLLVR